MLIKRRPSLLLLVTLCSPALAYQACGDPNGDGTINVLDSLFVAQAAVGLVTAAPLEFMFGDVDGDGDLDVLDALTIAQRSVMIPVFIECGLQPGFRIDLIGVPRDPAPKKSAPFQVQAGQPLDLLIVAIDGMGAPDPTFVGTVDVQLTGTTDVGGTPIFAASFTADFLPGDAGMKVVNSVSVPMGIGLATARNQTITVEHLPSRRIGTELVWAQHDIPAFLFQIDEQTALETFAAGPVQDPGGYPMPIVVAGGTPSPVPPTALPAADPVSGLQGETERLHVCFIDQFGNAIFGPVEVSSLAPAVAEVLDPVTGNPIPTATVFPDVVGVTTIDIRYGDLARVVDIQFSDPFFGIQTFVPLMGLGANPTGLDSIIIDDPRIGPTPGRQLVLGYDTTYELSVTPTVLLPLGATEVQWYYDYGVGELPIGVSGETVQLRFPNPAPASPTTTSSVRVTARMLDVITGDTVTLSSALLWLAAKVTLPAKVYLRANATMTAMQWTAVQAKINKIYARAAVCFTFERCDVAGNSVVPGEADATKRSGVGSTNRLTDLGLSIVMAAGFPVALDKIQCFFFSNSGGMFNGLAEACLDPASGVQNCFIDGPGTAGAGTGGFRAEVANTPECKMGVTMAHEFWHLITGKYDPAAGATPDGNSLTDSQVTGTKMSSSEAFKINRCARKLFP